ncbi:DUF4238 domain-containing protein [Rhizobium leguminosarum]|uniref:DUF4238 domain-containing protein n=1 Tax=Rhizobium leguminosarum TaxID=384 RepID=UPI001C97EE2E|nr:DUF4238 domain-containing protein [Rhizobium leguminosarum]MBY5533624.1 DUF4238 domain-containing protein [Rhizobium leguminosarum]
MKSHYIPQFYLKQWEGTDGKLEVFLRRSDGLIVSKRLHRKATGYAVDLYKLPGVSPEDEYKMESAFMAPIDDEAVHARDLLLGGITPAGGRTRNAWARFVLSLMLRNPEEVAEFKKNYANLIMMPQQEFQAKYAAIRHEGDPNRFEEWMVQNDVTHVERSAMFAITTFIEHPRVLHLFQNMHWMVIDTSSVKRRLMTSDRPVMLTQGMLQFAGHYALPISPTRLFLAATTVQFAQQFASLRPGKIVREINKLVIGQARKYVYAVDGTCLGDVRREMGKLPAPTILGPMLRANEARKIAEANLLPANPPTTGPSVPETA